MPIDNKSPWHPLTLPVLTYAIIAMMAHRCGKTYDETVEILSGVKEVKCTNGLRSPVELTRDQKELLEKLSIEL